MTTPRMFDPLGLLVPMAETPHPVTGRMTNRELAKGFGNFAAMLRQKLKAFPANAPIMFVTPGGWAKEDGDLQLHEQMLVGWGMNKIARDGLMANWKLLLEDLRSGGHPVIMHIGAPRTCEAPDKRHYIREVAEVLVHCDAVSFDATAQSVVGRFDYEVMNAYRSLGVKIITEGWIGGSSPFAWEADVGCFVTTENYRSIHSRKWNAAELRPIDEWACDKDPASERLIGAVIDSKWNKPEALNTTLDMMARGCTMFMDVYPDGHKHAGQTFPGWTPKALLQRARQMQAKKENA